MKGIVLCLLYTHTSLPEDYRHGGERPQASLTETLVQAADKRDNVCQSSSKLASMKHRFRQSTCGWMLAVAVVLINAPAMAAPPATTNGTWQLDWESEFEGTSLDASKWETSPEWARQGGACYWEADNHSLDGSGLLQLSVTETNGTVYCGAIRTLNRYEPTYGYFEVRCTTPQIHGGWAAFWLMKYPMTDYDSGTNGTEMDVFETINGWDNKVNHALHWGGYADGHQSEGKVLANRTDIYDGGYHTFGLWWSTNVYVFYIDGVETWRTDCSGTPGGGISQAPQFLQLSLEVSGQTWPGDWANQVDKPIHWYVDYVRAYEYIPPHTVTFVVGSNGTRSGGGDLIQTVENGSAAVEPTVTPNAGYMFVDWDAAFTNITSDISINAVYLRTVPFAEDFETLNLGDLAGQNGWQARNAVVQTNVAILQGLVHGAAIESGA